MRRFHFLLMTAWLLMMCGCGQKGGDSRTELPPEADSVAATVEVARLDLMATQWGALDSARQARSLAEDAELWQPLLMMARIDTVASPEALTRYAATPAVKMFGPEVEKLFPASDGALSEQVSNMLGRLWAMAPGVPTPRIAAALLPYSQSIILTDSAHIAYIATNHYLGPEHPAYRGFPEYVKAQKRSERIAPDLAEALLRTAYPADSAATVLQRLLYEGAVVEAVARACALDEQGALGYSAEEYGRATADEAAAWNALLTRKMLFSSDLDVASRLVDPSPSTSILNGSTPGRLGRFIGHRIVAAWLKNNPEKGSIPFLLSPGFFANPDILSQAAYSPK